MQTDSNRLLQKRYMTVQPHHEPTDAQILDQARESVRNALIREPKMPAAELAAVMMKEADPALAQRLADILQAQFYADAIRDERRKEGQAKRSQLLLPGFEHLPLKLPAHKKNARMIRLLDATYTRVRAYYWSLRNRHDKRKQNDPQVLEAKALMERMRKRTRKDKGITVREVLAEG